MQLSVIRRGDQREIREASLQPLHHFIAAAVPQPDLDARKFRAEPGDPPRKQKRRAAFHKADVEAAGKPLHGLQFLQSLVGQLQDLPGAAVQVRSGVRDGQAALPADEKLNAQLLFQSLDLAG